MSPPTPPSRADLEAHQLGRLRALLAALTAGNRFYQPRLAAAGLGAEVESLEAFRSRAPFTTKQEIVADQAACPPYGSDLSFPLERYTRFSQTSGTTGAPLRWLDTPESWEGMLDNWRRVYEASGVSGGDRVLFAFSFGPFLGFWTAFEAACRLGCLCIPGGGLSSSARLQAVMVNRVSVLCCTPTYALRLAEVAAADGLDLGESAVRALIVAGEPGGSIPATRARIERCWPGARVFDHHGMTEVGPVSYPCPRRPDRLHVMENAFLAEVVDPWSGRPAPPGEPGELVLTTLARVGSPLLRYRTGDVVRPVIESPCACGSYELGLDGGILARTDDMVCIRGVNVYPGAVDQIVRGCDGVAEYRVEVMQAAAQAELRVCVEPSAGCAEPGGLAGAVEKALRDALALRVPVIIVPPGTLPRFEMKARRWVRVETV
ncbi:MAG: AMP-binding protein [Phycisphaerae bacterium]|jgi:phenylacetate-CoA ligase